MELCRGIPIVLHGMVQRNAIEREKHVNSQTVERSNSMNMTQGKTNMVFGYVRVSTENQLENYSIDEQVQRLNAYCAAKGWVMLKIYTDGGFSGGNMDRPALRQMLQDIRKTEVDAVIVYKLDRLSRSQKDTLTLIEDEFLAHNVDFISINENFDTTSPFGRAMIGILSVFAQLEKDQITERFTMGRIGRGKAGYYHGGGIIPMGYLYKDGELIVDQYKALMVREIFAAFLHGKSINAIWHDMEEKYDGHWSAPKVRMILTNSVYIGKVKFAGVEYDGRHEPIVSRADFDAVRRLLSSFERESKKSASQKNPFRAGYMLSGLVRCARCGAKYSAVHGYYKCCSRSKCSEKYIVDPLCKNDNWQIETLDALVYKEICTLLDSPDVLQNLIKNADLEHKSVDTTDVQRRVAELDKQIEKLLDLYQIGNIPMEAITQRVNALDLEKRRLLDEIGEAQTRVKPRSAFFLEAAEQFKTSFDSGDTAARRLIISSLIESIVIDGSDVSIHWRL